MNKEHKLQIEVRTERLSFFLMGKQRFQVIQDEPFELSLVIKNIGDTALDGCKISNLSLRSSLEQKIYHPIQMEFTIPGINPGEEYDLKITKMLTILSGQAWISLNIKPVNELENIKTFQFDKATNRPSEEKINSWGDSILIYSQAENASRKTNSMLLWLTIITAWEAIFGLKSTGLFILNSFSLIFFWLGNIFKI